MLLIVKRYVIPVPENILIYLCQRMVCARQVFFIRASPLGQGIHRGIARNPQAPDNPLCRRLRLRYKEARVAYPKPRDGRLRIGRFCQRDVPQGKMILQVGHIPHRIGFVQTEDLLACPIRNGAAQVYGYRSAAQGPADGDMPGVVGQEDPLRPSASGDFESSTINIHPATGGDGCPLIDA